MIKKLAISLHLLICCKFLLAQAFTGGFSFSLPPFDSSHQTFLPHFEKKAITEFVRASHDGRFLAGGHPIRFWGVNLTTGGCFPPKPDAAGITGRMRKMGINLVRFHHLDNPWMDKQNSIFNQDGSTTSLNPVTLDRLFKLLAAMKAEGIYANINLHVSRTFTEQDGVLHADSIPDFGKAVTIFDEQLIALQKQYARQLLTTTNPYTGLALAEDPVMAMVEITNENTLYGYWRGDRLQPFAEGGSILSRHSDTLDVKWNRFLQEQYETHARLKSAWGGPATEGENNLIRDGSFEQGTISNRWLLEEHQTATASVRASRNDPYEGLFSAEINVGRATGTAWHIQFRQAGIPLTKDSVYLIRFFARADREREITVGAMRDAAPWTWYGGKRFALNTEWREFSFSFKAPESTADLGRLTLQFGSESGTYWIDKVSLSPGRRQGLLAGENLDESSVRRIRYSERFGFHPRRMADMAAFYLKLQSDYYEEMHRFLTGELGVKVPVTGSNALGGIYEPYTHRSLDYIDDHAYWDHPRFPNQPWSPTDWTIDNTSMLADDFLGTVPRIFGGYQVQDKPFTISEYNHAQPNIYQVEMLPVMAAYGAFHGVDGMMFFDYKDGDYEDWHTDRQEGYIELHRNTPVMTLFPLFSYAYRQGWIKEEPHPVTIEYDEGFLYRHIPEEDQNGWWGKYYPYDHRLALTRSIRISGFSGNEVELPEHPLGNLPYRTSTNETTFFPDKQLLLLQTPQMACISGQLSNAQQIDSGKLQVVRGEKHGVLAWLSLTEDPLETSNRSILALASRFQNQNMGWDGTTTLHNNWGTAPTEVQALDIEVQLNIQADSLRIYPLNTIGAQRAGFTVYPSGAGTFRIRIDQQQLKSLWFGVEAFNVTTSSPGTVTQSKISVFPNPVSEDGVLTLSGLERQTAYRICNLTGQIVQEGTCREKVLLRDLAAGVYFLVVRTEVGLVIEKIVVD